MQITLNGVDVSNMWKVNTMQFLKEIANNPQCAILSQPINIFGRILYDIAERALELQDKKMIALCCRLSLYEQADPYSKEFDQKAMDKLMKEVYPEMYQNQ